MEVVIHGGYQECRGAGIGKNSFYVENIAEELDVAREWFLSGDGQLRCVECRRAVYARGSESGGAHSSSLVDPRRFLLQSL
jgi:hypothetical protein